MVENLKMPSESFCEKHGIVHEFSSPRTTQQNGVVEL
jgi:transposase InsO family protein